MTFDGNRVEGAAAIVGGPDFVDSDFAGFFVDGDFCDLRRVRVRGGRAYACAFVFASAGFGRGRVGAGAGQGAAEIDCGDYRFFEGH